MIKNISRIILVDDNEIDNYLSHAIIGNMKITDEIVALCNGREALDYIKSNCNSGLREIENLIFLDINMPIMDGFQFLEEFKLFKKQEKFIVVMVSSSTDEHDKIRSFKLNASYFIEKPLNKEEIMTFLNTQPFNAPL